MNEAITDAWQRAGKSWKVEAKGILSSPVNELKKHPCVLLCCNLQSRARKDEFINMQISSTLLVREDIPSKS